MKKRRQSEFESMKSVQKIKQTSSCSTSEKMTSTNTPFLMECLLCSYLILLGSTEPSNSSTGWAWLDIVILPKELLILEFRFNLRFFWVFFKN